MPRYVAFLRGVSPMNAKMPDLKRCFEDAGFTDVRTLLSSGNVVFSTRATSTPALERRVENSMQASLGHSFDSFVRRTDALQALLASDPFDAFRLPPEARRVITFLREPAAPDALELPLRKGNASILAIRDTEVFSAYVPDDRGPVFMQLLERSFGKDITTRTLDTVRKCARA